MKIVAFLALMLTGCAEQGLDVDSDAQVLDFLIQQENDYKVSRNPKTAKLIDNWNK